MDFSNLVAACEDAWRSIQTYNPEIPDVVVVVGSGGRMSPNLFAKDTWYRDGEKQGVLHEVLIVAEQLHRTPVEIFTTLLHEATHGLAHARGIKDVSGRRHNKKFANLASEMGMIPPEKADSRVGYSAATMTQEAIDAYDRDIELIAEQLKLCRKIKLVEKETKKTTWMAECGCDRKIRIPKKTIDDPEYLNIDCAICGNSFKLTEEDFDIYVETYSNT